MNQKVIQWFEADEMKEALLGRGPYFIQEPMYRDHNILLIINSLYDWVEFKGIEYVSKKFESIIIELIKDSFSDAIEIIFSFLLINMKRKRRLIIDYNYLRNNLKEGITNNQNLIKTNKDIKIKINKIAEDLPGLI